jgi:GntR family transcriptional regulator, phosphonate transport system regulatory protein
MKDAIRETVDRKNGVALWRQIADDIRKAISGGEFAEAGKLPGEMALASRFGVNRHTVRAAISALHAEGIVKPMPGKGTEILSIQRFSMPISHRTRFSSGLGGQARRPEAVYLSSREGAASKEVAAALHIEVGATCVILETLGLADGVPVSVALSHFPATRFRGIDEHFRRERSVTKAFAAMGLADYVRQSTDISARHADDAEREWLRLTAGGIVLETISVNIDLSGVPVQYARTRFSSTRVSLHVGNEMALS